MSAAIYVEWIKAYVERHRATGILGRCRQASEEMRAVFPELRLVRGHVHVIGMHAGSRAHWWLETADGTVVDPTESQFPAVLDYDEWRPGHPVRISKCMDCGQEIWQEVESLDNVPEQRFCDEGCRRSFAASLIEEVS